MTFISEQQITRSMSLQLSLMAWTIGAFGSALVLAFFGEGGRLVDLAANDVAGDDDDEAQQERECASPRS